MANHEPPNPAAAAKEGRTQRSIRLPESKWLRVEALAQKHNTTLTALVEQAVDYYLAAVDKRR